MGKKTSDDTEKRLSRLEKIMSKFLGMPLEKAEEEIERKDEVVEELNFEKSVIRTYKSGRIEHLRKCPYCLALVHDLATHKATCPKRPAY